MTNADIKKFQDRLTDIMCVAEYIHDECAEDRIDIACADSIATHNMSEVIDLLKQSILLVDELIIK